MTNRDKPIIIDVFCGAGGLSYGFQQEGYKVIAGVDNNKYAQITYISNFPEAQFYSEDIRSINPKTVMSALELKSGELDCLIGGPPCQGFSVKGNMGLNDPRNLLFENFMNAENRCARSV